MILRILGAVLCLLASVWAQGAWTVGRVDPAGGNHQYIGVDGQGIVLLTPAKGLDITNNMGKGARICDIPSQDAGIVAGSPIWESSADGGLLSFVTEGLGEHRWNRVLINANRECQFLPSIPLQGLQAWATTERGVYFYANTGWQVLSFSASAQLVSASLALGQPQALAGRSGVLLGIGPDGLWSCQEDELGELSECQSLSTTLPQGLLAGTGEFFETENGYGFACLGTGDSLRYFESGQWHTLGNISFPSAGQIRPRIANGHLVGFQVRNAEGLVVDVALAQQANEEQLLRSWSYFAGTRWVNGRFAQILTDEVAEAGETPSAFVQVGRFVSRIWGYFFHRAGFVLSDFVIQPAAYSPGLHGNLLLQFRPVGDGAAQMQVGIYTDSLEGTQIRELLNENVRYSLNQLSVLGSDLPEGEMYVRVRLAGQADTLVAYRRLLVDKTPPQGVLVANLRKDPSVPLHLMSGEMRLAENHELVLDLGAVYDTPLADAVVKLQLELRHLTTHQSVAWEYEVRGDSSERSIRLNGNSPAGIPLLRGSYSLQWRLQDSLGNAGPWQQQFAVTHGDTAHEVASLLVDRLDVSLGGSVQPLLLQSIHDYRGTVKLQAVGLPLDTLTGSMQVGNVAINQPFTLILDSTGRWDSTWVEQLGPGQQGIQSGGNVLVFRVQNSHGLYKHAELPFVVDRLETVIYAPLEGQQTWDVTAVRGIAAAPTLNENGGYGHYKSYWAPGTVTVPLGLSLSNLMALAQWRPMKVPLLAQSSRLATGIAQAPYDALFPESNIGFLERTSEGVLAFFAPDSTQEPGEYTLLVVGRDSTGAEISYDSKRVFWSRSLADSTRSVANLQLLDSTGYELDLSETGNPLDSLVFRLHMENHPMPAVLFLMDSTNAMLQRRNLFLDGQTPSRWVFTGENAAGHALAEGRYQIVVEGFQAELGRQFRVAAWVQLKRGNQALASIFQLDPDTSYSLPQAGLRPLVQMRVRKASADWFRLTLHDGMTGAQLRVLEDGTHAASGDWEWNFTDEAGESVLGNAQLQHFEARLRYVADSDTLEINRSFYVRTLDLLEVAGAPIDVGNTTSEYKFRARPKGVLRYFPVRYVDYSPRVSGKQVLRKFVTVPYNVEFKKFYNSVEVVSEGYYQMKGSSSRTWHKHPKIEYPGRYQTFYATGGRNFEVNQDRNVLHSAWVAGNANTPFWGDLPYYTHMPSDALNHACNFRQTWRDSTWLASPLPAWRGIPCVNYTHEPGIGGYSCRTGPSAESHCNVFALCPKQDYHDGWGYDSWDELQGGIISAYLVQPRRTQGEDKGKLIFFANMRDGVAKFNPYLGEGMVLDTRASVDSPVWPYWRYRDVADVTFGTTHEHNYDDGNFQEDGEYQSAYLRLPQLNWNHQYLTVTGVLQDSINYYAMGNHPDPVSWAQTSTNPVCDTAADSTVTCYGTFGGTKQGIRGAALRPLVANKTNAWGRQVAQHEYIQNFFVRDTDGAHMRWKGNPGRDDDLLFDPQLDISDSMFKVTWDTVMAPFPMDMEEFAKSALLEVDSLGVVRAFYTGEGFSYHPFTADSTQYLQLRAQHFAHQVQGVASVDSVLLPLGPLFAQVLAQTDTATGRQPALYRYILSDSNTLHFAVELASHYMLGNRLVRESDTNAIFHLVRIERTPQGPQAWIHYLNTPKQDSTWSAAEDPGLAPTRGYLYGQQRFNQDNEFRARGVALDSTGFLGLVNSANLNLSLPTPESRSPFHVDSAGKVIWNPNIDAHGFSWDMDVFYADGASINSDLDTLGADRSNFNIGLSQGGGSRSYRAIRGNIAPRLAHGGRVYHYAGYRLFAIPDSGNAQGIPVNKFYVRQGTAALHADLYPDPALDLWNRDSLAVLGYWEQTRLGGLYEVALVVDYSDSLSGDIKNWVQRTHAPAGVVVQDPSSPIEVVAPYNRAALILEPPAVQIGDVVSLHSLSLADMGEDFPEVLPIGPVLEVKTTGPRSFVPPNLPLLQFRLTAREIFREQNWNFENEDLTLDSIVDALESVMADYRIHMYGEAKTLDPMTTLAAVQRGVTREDTYLELSAQVRHFSLAMVVKSSQNGGLLPVITRVERLGDRVFVDGYYQAGMSSTQPAFSANELPTDLELLLRDKSLRDTTGQNLFQMDLSVDVYGAFRASIPWTQIPEGGVHAIVRYRNAQQGARARIANDSGRQILTNLKVAGEPVRPVCGLEVAWLDYTTNIQGNGSLYLLDSNGTQLSLQAIAVTENLPAHGWDGCLHGAPVAEGRYLFALWLDSGRVRDTVAFAVGVRYLSNVNQIRVEFDPFVPSTSDPAHTQRIYVQAQGYSESQLQLWVTCQDALAQEVPLVPSNLPGWFQAQWSAGTLTTGRCTVRAQVRGAVGVYKQQEFSIQTREPLNMQLNVTPEPLPIPLNEGTVQVQAQRAVNGKIWLELEDGNLLWILGGAGEQWGNVPAGSSTWLFNLRDSLQALPVRAFFRYLSASGQSGVLQKNLTIALGAPKLTVGTSTPDTIYPEKAHLGLPGQFVTDFYAGETLTLELRVLRNNSQVYSREIGPLLGPGAIAWDGRTQDSLLVEEGNYRMQLFARPRHAREVSQVLFERDGWVSRLPQVAICVGDAPSLVANPMDLAEKLRTALLAKGLHSVHIMNAQSTVEYMSLAPSGVVAFVQGLAPSPLYGVDQRSNAVRGFVSRGGRVAFVGGLPLLWTQDGAVVRQQPAVSIPLYGLAEPYTRLDSLQVLADSLFRNATLLEKVDSNQIQDMAWLTSGADQRLFQGIDLRRLTRAGMLAVAIDGTDTLAAGFYLKPQYAGSDDSTGAIVSRYATEQPITLGDNSLVARDFAASIDRYFFSPDLSIQRSGVRIATTSDFVLRGGEHQLGLKPRYIGDMPLDSVVVRVLDPNNGGFDTVHVYRNVTMASTLMFTYRARVDSLAPFGAHQLRVQVDPFQQIVDQDTVLEKMRSNNVIEVNYEVGDTSTPVIEVLQTQAAAMRALYSGRNGTPPYVVNSEITVSHGQGAVGVRLQVLAGTGNDLLYQDSIAVPAGLAQAARFQLPMNLPIPSQGWLTVRVGAEDKYGNQASRDYQLLADTVPPNITELGIPRALEDTLGSGAVEPSDWVRKFFPRTPESQDTLELTVVENQGIKNIFWYYAPQTEDGLETYSLIHADTGKVLGITALTSRLSIGQRSGNFRVVVEDHAGNRDERIVRYLLDTDAPLLSLRVVEGSILDTVSGISYTQYRKIMRSRYWDSTQVETLIADEVRGGAYEYDAYGKSVLRLAMDALDLSIVSWTLNIDGLPYSITDLNPYLDDSDPRALTPQLQYAVRVNDKSRYLELPISQPRHLLQLVATDQMGNRTELTLQYGSALGDLQIVDPEGDLIAGTAPDIGEVYMRYDDRVEPGAEPQTWVYWLIHRWDGGPTSDQGTVNLYVDIDNDPATGASYDSLRGADLLLRLTPSTSDAGGVVRVLEWSASTSAFVERAGQWPEGLDPLTGIAQNANQMDDLETAPIGEGPQVLPSERIAQAANGVWEVGVALPGNAATRPVGWAIETYSASGALGDRVVDSTSRGLLRFLPGRPKSVEVDGRTPDWLGVQQNARDLEVFSTLVRDPNLLRIGLEVRNPADLLSPVFGFSLRYFLRASQTPALALAVTEGSGALQTVPASWATAVAIEPTVVRANTLNGLSGLSDDIWVATLRCETCVLNPGEERVAVGTLLLDSLTALLPEDDWSYASTAEYRNPRIVAYRLDGTRLSGELPTAGTTGNPVARITAIPALDTSAMLVGALRHYSALTSSDPLGRPLQFHWMWDGRPGWKFGNRDTVGHVQPGTYRLVLRACDTTVVGRCGYDRIDIRVLDSLTYGYPQIQLNSSMVLFDDSLSQAWRSYVRWPYAIGSAFLTDSVAVLPASPYAPMAHITPVEGRRFLVVPFRSIPDLEGVGLTYIAVTPDLPNYLQLSDYTHLEFWIASEMAGPDLPVRLWINQIEGGSFGNTKNEEDFVYIQSYLGTSGSLARHWQRVLIPLQELNMRVGVSQFSFLKMQLDKSSGSIYNPGRSNLYLDNIRFVNLTETLGRKPSTRVSTVAMVASPNVNEPQSWWMGTTLKLVNSGSQTLNMDSLRLRYYFNTANAPGKTADESDVVGVLYGGTRDEYVDTMVYWPEIGIHELTSLISSPDGRRANRFVELTWQGKGVIMPGGTGFAMYMQIVRRSNNNIFPYDMTVGSQSLQHSFPSLPKEYYRMHNYVVVEYQVPGGQWVRLAGMAPGETQLEQVAWGNLDNSVYPGRQVPQIPETPPGGGDTIPPGGGDTIPPGGGTTPPPATSTPHGNVAGDTSGWTIAGPNLEVQVVEVEGSSGLQLDATNPGPMLNAVFIVDSLWLRSGEVQLDLLLPSDYYGLSHYLGDVTLHLNYGIGRTHTECPASSGTTLSLEEALGQWHTYRFTYPAAALQLGDSLHFSIHLNANAGGEGGRYIVGAFRVADSPGTGGTTSSSSTAAAQSSSSVANPAGAVIQGPFEVEPGSGTFFTGPVVPESHWESGLGFSAEVYLSTGMMVDGWGDLTLNFSGGTNNSVQSRITIPLTGIPTLQWTTVYFSRPLAGIYGQPNLTIELIKNFGGQSQHILYIRNVRVYP